MDARLTEQDWMLLLLDEESLIRFGAVLGLRARMPSLEFDLVASSGPESLPS